MAQTVDLGPSAPELPPAAPDPQPVPTDSLPIAPKAPGTDVRGEGTFRVPAARSDSSESGPTVPGTWPGRAIALTVDSVPDLAPENRGSGYDMTLDSGSSPELALVTRMWDSGEMADAVPEMTLKGAKAPEKPALPQPNQSLLVIKSRTVADDAGGEQAAPSTPATAAGADYEILNQLGQGGMGVVYAARQASIYRTVALKMLRPELAKDADQRQKFLAEAAVTGDLEHPNIVPIYDLAVNDDGTLFYAMKRVKGTPWLKVIDQKTAEENLEILMKVADAVAFAHSRGVVHRDLKPENVMLGDFGEVLVMDWGLAQSKDHSQRVGAPKVSTLAGTPAYMAPEMATGPVEKIGPLSDVYLLGAILYEIITGHPPHRGKDVMKCLLAAARNELAPTEKTGELIDIARKAMATRPGDRYSSVVELQKAIRSYRAHTESIGLSLRAQEDLERAAKNQDYQLFSRALFGYEEAAILWPENDKARHGVQAARLAYAECALAKADIDLGMSLIDGSDPAHADLLARLKAARYEREQRLRRLRTAKLATAVLAAGLLIGGVVSYLQIRAGRDRALLAESDARESEQEARSAEKTAREAEGRATQSAKEAREAETEARKQERAANQAKEAEEYQAYLARIGLAAAKVDENSFDTARSALDACKPTLRNWEWGRLRFLSRQNIELAAQGPASSTAFSSDGHRLAAGSWDGKVRIWNTADWSAAPLEISAGGLYVQAVALSPDGARIAVGGSDPAGAILIFSTTDGSLLATLNGHSDAVLSLAYSRDGRRLLSSSYDKSAILWDLESNRPDHVYAGHTWWVWQAAFSPDEREIATAGQDGVVFVWPVDHREGDPLPAFRGHRGPVYSVAWSPDGRTIASAGYDGRVLLSDRDDVRPFDFKRLADDEALDPPVFRALDDHDGPVRNVNFSADGRTLTTASQDNTVKLWNVETGRVEKTLRGHAGWVYASNFSPDGRWVASAGHDQRVRLWDVNAYAEVRVLGTQVFSGHSDAVLGASFSGDGRQIVTASRDRTARTWDSRTGQPIRFLAEGHEFLASSVLVSADSKRLITAAADGTVRLWDAATGGELRVFAATGRSAAVALSHDGASLLTGGDYTADAGWQAVLWNANTAERSAVFSGHSSEVTAVAFSADDRLAATADAGGHVRLWDVATRQLLKALEGHSRKITALAFTPDGSRLLSASADGTVGQWLLPDGNENLERVLKHPGAVTGMALIPDGSRLLTACDDGKVRLWDLTSAALAGFLPDPSSTVNALAVSADGRTALTASTTDQTVRLWDLNALSEFPSSAENGAPFVDLRKHGGIVWAACISPDGTSFATVGGNSARLWSLADGRPMMEFNPHGAVACAIFDSAGGKVLTGSWDQSAKVWNLDTGRVDFKLAGGHEGRINAAAWSADGSRILTAGDDGVCVLWDAADGRLLKRLVGHTGRVRAVAFLDARRAVTGSDDKTLRLWDLESGQSQAVWTGHTWGVTSVAVSRDGTRVVSGSDDNTARVWNVADGRPLATLAGHTAGVTSVALLPDGTRVLTASKDTTARLWDAHTGKEVLTLSGHGQEVTSVSFSPDGLWALTASRDGTAVLWQAEDWRLESSSTAARSQ